MFEIVGLDLKITKDRYDFGNRHFGLRFKKIKEAWDVLLKVELYF
jgi:hypothetical protein